MRRSSDDLRSACMDVWCSCGRDGYPATSDRGARGRIIERMRTEMAVTKAYLEDLAPGQVFASDARAVVDAASIKRFSGEFDRQPFHLDEAAAQPTFFQELVASGWHTTAMTM